MGSKAFANGGSVGSGVAVLIIKYSWVLVVGVPYAVASEAELIVFRVCESPICEEVGFIWHLVVFRYFREVVIIVDGAS